MQIAQYLIDAAEKLLQFEGDSSLPKQLADTRYYLAHADDQSVTAFGVTKFGDKEYKIGTKKQK